jgi:hypothetical protein
MAAPLPRLVPEIRLTSGFCWASMTSAAAFAARAAWDASALIEAVRDRAAADPITAPRASTTSASLLGWLSALGLTQLARISEASSRIWASFAARSARIRASQREKWRSSDHTAAIPSAAWAKAIRHSAMSVLHSPHMCQSGRNLAERKAYVNKPPGEIPPAVDIMRRSWGAVGPRPRARSEWYRRRSPQLLQEAILAARAEARGCGTRPPWSWSQAQAGRVCLMVLV